MGWTEFDDFSHLSRADIVQRELSQAATPENPKARGFNQLWERGSTVYAVAWHENPEKFAGRMYFGLVVLTRRKNGRFAYKDMDESMEPFSYDAPVVMLDMLDTLAPDAPESARHWRALCRIKHGKRQEKRKAHATLKPGDIVKFSPDGAAFELIMPAGPRRGWNVRMLGANGSLYRATAKQIANCQIVKG